MQGFEIFETPEGQEMLEELGQAIGEALEGMNVELEYSGPPSNREVAYESTPAKQELEYSGPPSNREVAYESTPAKQEVMERRVSQVSILEVDEVNKAPSMEVQAREIGEYFRETPELQYENWIKLSVDERVEALQAFENEVAAIAHRPAIEVRAETMKEGLFGENRGTCQVINTTYLMDNSRDMYVETLDTLIHEGRHGYQNWNVTLAELGAPVVEQNLEWVNSWRVNMLDLGYSQSDAKSFDGMGFERYYTQPIEVDARAFAAQAIHEMGLR